MVGVRLTEKQKQFCDFYIETLNATEAALKAGYSSRTARFIGSENLTKPHIQNYIDQRLKELESRRIADAKEVLEYLTAVMRGEEEETVIVGGEFGIEKVKKEPSIRERNKAAELLGRRYSLFTDKIDIGGTVGVQIIDNIPDDDSDDEN